jgi:hypothetical protein
MPAKKHSSKAAKRAAVRHGDKEAAPALPQPRGEHGRGKVGGDQAMPNVRRYAFRRT